MSAAVSACRISVHVPLEIPTPEYNELILMRTETHVADSLDSIVDLEGLRSVFDDADVQYVVVFGSYASGTASTSSDLDIGIRFADTCSRHDRFRQRNRLDAIVQSSAEPAVDVSDLEALPETVALNALQNGVLIYGNEAARAADENRLERRVENNSNKRDTQRRAFIDRLAEGDVWWSTTTSSSIDST